MVTSGSRRLLFVEEAKGVVDGGVAFGAVGPWVVGCRDHGEAEGRSRADEKVANARAGVGCRDRWPLARDPGGECSGGWET